MRKAARNNGRALEAAVARIQQMMDPQSTVTRNERLVDRVDNTRECDVVIRGTFAGRAALGVIECKDHRRRKGPGDVEAFAKKTEHLQANFRVMVSRKGFTPAALRLAKHEGIGCLSLLPDNMRSVGFGVGNMWYAAKVEPGIVLQVRWAVSPAPKVTFASQDVLYDGCPVVSWFKRSFMNALPESPWLAVPHDWHREVIFKQPRTLQIAGVPHAVRALAGFGVCNVTYLRQFVSWTGDAFYDWHDGKVHIPQGGTLVGAAVDTHLEEGWTKFDGPIPAPPNGLVELPQGVIYLRPHWRDTEPVIELEEL